VGEGCQCSQRDNNFEPRAVGEEMKDHNPRRDFVKTLLAGAAVTLPTAAFARATPAVANGAEHLGAIYNVLDFGAIGDGKTVCTAAIQETVDACAAAGGGKVIVPAGRYLTGPIHLKSNIEFEVLAGARLLLTNDFTSIPGIRYRPQDGPSYASLFTCVDAENVSITGRGILDGQGEMWWNAFRERAKSKKLGGRASATTEAMLKWGRPRVIKLYRCKNILIRGVTVVNSPSWNIHPLFCENIWIDGITISAPPDSPNTDGIDPESCKNVQITNCNISTGDDGVIIKSGEHYQEHGIACENIAVTNCVFGPGHAAVGVGSETSGGVRNVVISNCVCDGTDRGLRFKTARGRGNVVENVRVSNVVMHNVGEAISVTMFYNGGDKHAPEKVTELTPAFRNLHFSDLIASHVKHAAVIEGLPEMPIQGLSIHNYAVEDSVTGINCTNGTEIVFDTIVVNAQRGPALNVENVRELEIYRCTTKKPLVEEPVIRFQKVKDAVLQSCNAAVGTGTFLELNGTDNAEISLFTNRLSRATRDIGLVAGASASAIIREA
jgi:hypothetical protein